MNKDQVKGRMHEAEGSVKETAGKMAHSKSLEEKGSAQKTAGKGEAALGDQKQKAREEMKKHG